VLGFLAYLSPIAGMAIKKFYMPYHRFWGAALLALAGTTALLGITENAIYKKYVQFIYLFLKKKKKKNKTRQ
jgi:hypothetical protein